MIQSFLAQTVIFYIDTEIKKIFAISSVRVSRIKEDNFDISIILKNYKFLKTEKIVVFSSIFNKSQVTEEPRAVNSFEFTTFLVY